MDTILTRNQRKALSASYVSAGPGCGGTEILARRFMEAIQSGAARPDEVLVLARSRTALDAFRARVTTLSGKPVSRSTSVHTISSFCRRVLRENALDAGVDPRFSILGDAQWRIMAGRLADEVIEGRREDLTWLGFLPNDDPTPEALPAPFPAALAASAVRECILSVSRVHDDLTPAGVSDPLPFLEAFERCCMELIAPDDLPEKIIEPIRANLPKLLLTAHLLVSVELGEDFWKALRKFRTFRGPFGKKSGFADLDHALESARSAYDNFVAACLDRHSALCADFLRDLIAEFNDLCSDEKARLGLLDYADLPEKAARLLHDVRPEIARRYQDRFKLVIADCDGFGDAERQVLDAISRPGGLFRLDDGPQSARLTENFRGRKGILDFIDYLFGKVLGEDPVAEHQPMTSLRRYPRRSLRRYPRRSLRRYPRRSLRSFAPSPEPDVELIVVQRVAPDSTARRHRTEAAAIAERILEITGRGIAGRSVDFRDILILLRSPFDLRSYERILENHGIPACAIGARGFFDAPEVRDMINILRAICRPDDELAREQALNADISEDLLSELTSVHDRISAAGLIDLLLARTHFDLKLLGMRGGLRKYSNVRKLRDMAGDASTSDFLARIEEQILFGSREAEAPVRGPDGNVVRIMTIHEAGEIQSPVVFLADLSKRMGPNTGIAAIDPDRGLAVRPPSLVGINIPLNYREITEVARVRSVPREASLLHTAMTRAEERLILVGSSDLTDENKPTYRETTSWMGWIERALRLGPGSLTGVMDLGTCRVDLQFVEPKMHQPDLPENTLAALFLQELREGLPIPIVDPSAAMIADSEAASAADPGAGSASAEAARAAGNGAGSASDVVQRCLSAAPPAPRLVTRLSVSQALDYIECPARYRWRHIIGIPDQSPDPPDDPQDAEFSAADLGHVVHDLLSRLDFSRDTEPQVSGLLAGVTDEALRAEAGPIIRRFTDGRWCAELRKAGEVLKEVPFEFMIGGKVMAGRIDALYRTSEAASAAGNGAGSASSEGWTVLDYKTGRAEDRERYELQVGIYAHALHRLTGEMPSRAALLLLSIDDEWVRDTSDGSVAGSSADRIGDVIASIGVGGFEPSVGPHCDWCAFSSLCGKE